MKKKSKSIFKMSETLSMTLLLLLEKKKNFFKNIARLPLVQLGQAGHPDMRLASFLTLSQRPHPALGLDQPRRCTVSLLLWGQNRPLEFPGPRFLWGVCASVLTLRPRSRGQACPARPPGCRPRVG